MSAARPRVQFVSKPIVAPFRDGTKCLVRDWVTHFRYVDARVLGTPQGAPELDGFARVESVYPTDGAFAPALSQNLRAALWLLLRSRVDIWHFVFAPNRRSSQVGRALRALRRVPVVQTIASPPRSFDDPTSLLFGDVVVAQSAWTKSEFERAWPSGVERPDLRVIPPPAPVLGALEPAQIELVRQRLRVTATTPLFVYPGDLEVSRGAAHFAELSRAARDVGSDAVFVFAYRDKSSAADEHAAKWRASLGENVRFEKNVPDIHALVAAATAIVFPVEDLYGKVDLPIVLLEAMGLGTPVLALNEGPLAGLEGAERARFDARAWLERLNSWSVSRDARAERAALGHAAVRETYAAERVAGLYESIYGELVRQG